MEKAHYAHLAQLRADMSNAFDKNVLTLAGGALGLSVTFVSEVMGRQPNQLGWLAWGWVLLAFSLLMVTISFILSQRTMTLAMVESSKATVWNRATIVTNAFALVGLVGGLGSLARFAFVNLK